MHTEKKMNQISIRIDDETLQRIMDYRKRFNEKFKCTLSASEIIRIAIDVMPNP